MIPLPDLGLNQIQLYHRCPSTISSNYRRPHPWSRTSGTRDDLTPGLQLGLEPTTQALESNASTTMPWNVLTDDEPVCV